MDEHTPQSPSDLTRSQYPVGIEIEQSDEFDRMGALLRILAYILTGWVLSAGLMLVIFLSVPLVTGLLIARATPRGFYDRYGGTYVRILRTTTAIYAWLLFVTDRFPVWAEDRPVTVAMRQLPSPTVGEAILRTLLVIPHVLLWSFLDLIGHIFAVGAFVWIIFTGRPPEIVKKINVAISAYFGRMLAYYLSLVDRYPPFTFDLDP